MERLNLSLPGEARTLLKRLAREEDRTEGEFARELMLEALRRLERRTLIEKAIRAQTPARRARRLEIARALERWR